MPTLADVSCGCNNRLIAKAAAAEQRCASFKLPRGRHVHVGIQKLLRKHTLHGSACRTDCGQDLCPCGARESNPIADLYNPPRNIEGRWRTKEQERIRRSLGCIVCHEATSNNLHLKTCQPGVRITVFTT